MLKSYGFTLLELLVSLAIVSILVSVAVPTYQSQIRAVYRSEAQVALQSIAVALETYYRQQLSYVGAELYDNDADRSALDTNQLFPKYLPKDYSGEDYAEQSRYVLSLETTPNTYSLSATAQGVQVETGSGCDTLTLNHLGVAGPSACWR